MTQTVTEVRAEAIGRISVAPELVRTMEGVPVCRFVVATDVGPASNPVVKTVYVIGKKNRKATEDLAVKCTHLGVGDLVIVPGIERQRQRRRGGVDWVESAIEASNVRLRERGERRDGGA